MEAPDIDWPLALRVSTVGTSDLPQIGQPELRRLVADLRGTARRAGRLVAAHLGIDSVGAADVRVVDWAGWGRAVSTMVGAVTSRLNLEPAPDGPIRRIRATGNGLLVGVGLRVAARRLLGQYDAYTGSDTLYLVAPSILAQERHHGFVADDFRLWVALHEQTHALQFRAAPWLDGWLSRRVELILNDEGSSVQGFAGWARTGDISSLFASGQAGDALAELTAAMTFLEGHADHTADTVGRPHIPSVDLLRRAFTRAPGPSGLGRLSRAFDKDAQYRDGLTFCRKVSSYRGRRALSAAFAEPTNLPTPTEIADPRAWVERVHG
ncbi:putative hydrolase/uncharacterized protein, coenzyme F420 biosynthesis associated [Tessaracoccus bendigoensis DSM 12906]|uniref:Putative hydrolase/uncharacterized protein, coenzyme F420 biosynthesis associated n=2 Tax=Tessaracoccus TaxID=72763 RepID=A0A1M6H4L5_9ACTN|nr:putative hydrolase/uncharacterized protein, coenzyme F420 biosynthesis associated [Tessaracoccus bendigoensis DSM 12906]